MVSEADTAGLVHDLKLSTVVPASMTGEDKNHQLSDVDLALKLHYITSVQFFSGDAAAELSIPELKKPMFECLQLYYPICGRIRRQEAGGGRPYIKCNDSGVRVVEATCSKTVEEWLAAVPTADHHRLLVYDQPLLAHDFGFTPLVFLQLSRFQCGGLCVGLRWAHFLGDAFSASQFLNAWGRFMSNQDAPRQLLTAPPPANREPPSSSLSAAKVVEAVGDNWVTPNKSKMQTHTFHITQKQLSNLLQGNTIEIEIEPFQIISAVVWKSMAKLKGTKIITVCGRNTKNDDEMPSNAHQVIGVVEAETSNLIAEADLLEIGKVIGEKLVDETGAIEKRMEEGKGVVDFVVYGANLTFINMEGVDVYGLQLKGRRPVLGSVSVRGVGDEGAVVVEADASGGGRLVNVIMSEDDLHHLRNHLRLDWAIL